MLAQSPPVVNGGGVALANVRLTPPPQAGFKWASSRFSSQRKR
jgi:hypothetical protein